MKQMTYAEALRDGMRVEIQRDPNVYLAGEDVGLFGGCFGQTAGLFQEFGPERIIDTPITETVIVGHAVGSRRRWFATNCGNYVHRLYGCVHG